MQHHAHCIVGDFETALALIPEAQRREGLDVTLTTHTSFSIDEARALKHASTQRPIEGHERVFILGIKSATLEAQNALLKLFEEPAVTSRFYIIIPFESVLIPTVRSRLMMERVEEGLGPEMKTITEFLQLPYNERLLLIAQKMKEKDDAWSEALMRGVELHTRANLKKGGADTLFVEKYIRGSGASKKMLLEHLALSL